MCESQRNQTIADVCQEEEKPYVLQSVTGAYESSIDPTRACSRRSPPPPNIRCGSIRAERGLRPRAFLQEADEEVGAPSL